MDVVIAGGHGQIALHLERLLSQRGDSVRGLIRNPEHAADLERMGAQAVICDLEAESDMRPFVEGADAVVYAVGTDVERGDIPRADVALTLLAVLDTASTVGKTFNVVSGDDPVDRAIQAL